MFLVVADDWLVNGRWLRSRDKESFVAITNLRVIQWEDENNVISVPFATMLNAGTRINYLMAMREIEIRVLPGMLSLFLRFISLLIRCLQDGDFHTTTVSRQSPFRLEYIDGLPEADRLLFLRLICDSIPTRATEATTDNFNSTLNDIE